MKKLAMTVLGLLMMAVSVSYAQNLTVTGIVKDSSTGEPVPFASIQIEGTMTGGMTDIDGLYSISVPSDGVLIFSSIGYKDVKVPVAGSTKHDVMLDPDTEMLEETIVVAFGTATKESFTGSATVVKSSDIAKTQSSDATRALEGVVAGVQMTTTSGAIGNESPRIMIRGASSISLTNDPLYVVDGIPMPVGSSLSNINPADIESMTVLKDAASNALYGARGANGVIMVTTKKAKHTDAVVNVDAKWGLNTKALRNYDYITDPGQYYEVYYAGLKNYLMNKQGMSDYEAHIAANQYMVASSDNEDATGYSLGYQVFYVPEGETFIGSNGRLNPSASLGRVVDYNGQSYWLTPDNWMDEAYRNTLRQEYNVSVSGTSGKASVLASFGYLNNKGITYGSDMYRYTARLRADYQAKDYLKIGGNFAYTHTNLNNSNTDEGSNASTGNIFAIANQIAPIYPLYVRDAMGRVMVDRYGYNIYDYGTGENAGASRPYLPNSNALQAALLDKNNSEGNAFSGTAYAEVKFLKDFTFTFNAGLGVEEARSSAVMNMYYGQYAPMGGYIGKSHARNTSLNLQQLLNWNRIFAGVHNVGVLLGHESYFIRGASLSASKSQMFSMENDELNGAVVDGKTAASSRSEYNNEGYFMRAQYDYMNRIFASVSYRRDASSRFHSDRWWGNFWSLGGGWIINQESWFPRAPWIDMLKVKASIGSQGNDNIADYLYTDMYSITNSDGEIGIKRGSIGNPDITWETNTNFNAGFDFDLFRGRLSGSLEYFYRLTSDMLYFVSIPISYGFSGYYDNIGDMRNSGIEFAVNGSIMNKRNFRWDAYLNFTHYTNKIIMLPDTHKNREIDGYFGYASGNKFVAEGLPLNTFLMPKYAGVDKTNGLPMWYKDILGDDGEVIGTTMTSEYSEATEYLCDDPTPTLYGGFGTSFSFYNFDISAAFTYSIGGLTYDSGYAALVGAPSQPGYNVHVDVLNAWSETNKDSDMPRYQYLDENINGTSDRFLVDASYLNIQNVQIGYTIPSDLTRRIKVDKIRVYLACDNIWYWSYRHGLDPRSSFSGGTNYASNSPVRTITGGINITF